MSKVLANFFIRRAYGGNVTVVDTTRLLNLLHAADRVLERKRRSKEGIQAYFALRAEGVLA